MGQGEPWVSPWAEGKKYKKLLQFFPLRQKRAIFFVYNNNIRFCPASLLNKVFLAIKGLSARKTLFNRLAGQRLILLL